MNQTEDRVTASFKLQGVATINIVLSTPVIMRGLNDCHYVETTAASNGQAYRIFVGGPLSTHADQRYPVIYVLDGKLNFAMVHAQCQLLSAMGQMPPAFVVGVAFAGDETFFAKDSALRQRDFTPNHGGSRESAMRILNDQGDTVTSGGARAFLGFLRDELKPAIEAGYPVDAGDATIIGHSLSGLFPSWVLFHEPETFQRYVLVSPSWWWNDYEIWRWEDQYAKTHRDLPVKIFATAGGLETAVNHQALIQRMAAAAAPDIRRRFDDYIDLADKSGWPQMAEIIPEFQARLKAREYTGLDLTAVVLPEENHESIPGVAFSRGLRFVFGSWRPDTQTR